MHSQIDALTNTLTHLHSQSLSHTRTHAHTHTYTHVVLSHAYCPLVTLISISISISMSIHLYLRVSPDDSMCESDDDISMYYNYIPLEEQVQLNAKTTKLLQDIKRLQESKHAVTRGSRKLR